MSKLQFRVIKERGNARLWEIQLNGVSLQTPVFMPVWTKATIKGIVLDLLKDPKYIGDLPEIQMILANTFHLYLRPGEALIKKAGGLHRFENRDKLILTDSGGFQVFSLWLNKWSENSSSSGHNVWVKLHEDGVSFRSPYDGSKHFFSPEKVVDIQCDLWSDVMMVLDVCSPADSTKEVYAEQMWLTHRWAQRQYEHFSKKYDSSRGVLFPIVQWGSYKDLREESIAVLSAFARDGIALWGVSVGESEPVKRDILAFCGPKLPSDVPRYLMGVGTPEDLIFSIEQGFDMFDCVLGTRLGRHGTAFGELDVKATKEKWQKVFERIKLRNAKYKEDFSPLTKTCPCFTCQNYTKAYLYHLIKEKEMLGGMLLSLHNIVYLHFLLEEWKREMRG